MVSGKRVLVATDLSTGGDEAIRQGDAWARADGGELLLVHVVPNLLRNNPLFPQRAQTETTGLLDMEHAAAQAVQERAEALTGREPGSLRDICPARSASRSTRVFRAGRAGSSRTTRTYT
jgi:nucleotide-binding universal stress UspA family protein